MRSAAILTLPVATARGGTESRAYVGDYSGENELSFLVIAPVRRKMPPERHRGAASVGGDDGTTVTLELRMFAGGEVCQVVAQRSGPAPTGRQSEIARWELDGRR